MFRTIKLPQLQTSGVCQCWVQWHVSWQDQSGRLHSKAAQMKLQQQKPALNTNTEAVEMLPHDAKWSQSWDQPWQVMTSLWWHLWKLCWTNAATGHIVKCKVTMHHLFECHHITTGRSTSQCQLQLAQVDRLQSQNNNNIAVTKTTIFVERKELSQTLKDPGDDNLMTNCTVTTSHPKVALNTHINNMKSSQKNSV